MADEVEIVNVGNGGTVASEETLAKLVAAVDKLSQSVGKSSQGAKVQELYNAAVAKGTTTTKNNTTSQKINTDAFKDNTSKIKLSSIALDAFKTALGQLTGSTVGLANEFLRGGDGVADFTKHIPLIGGYLGSLAGFLDDSVGTFRNLSSTGAGFNNSVSEMLGTAARLELNLGEMAQFVSSNSQSLASLGGTVQQGITRFTAMNRTLKATGDFAALKNMGFTVEQINEGMGDYISLQARMGTLQGRSTAQLAAGSANYLEQIDRLAKVTGKTREEAEAALAAQAQDSAIRTLLNQFEEGSEEFNNLQMSLGLLDEVGGSTAEALKGMLTGNPTEEAGRLLGILGEAGPAVLSAMESIGDGADPQIMLEAFKNAGGQLEQFAGEDADGRARIIQAMRASGDPMADFLDAATRMVDIGNRDLSTLEEQQRSRDELTETLATFDDRMKRIRGALASALLDSGVLDLIATGLEAFANLISGFGEGLTEVVDAFNNGTWLDGIVTALTNSIGGLFNNAGVIAALVAGIGGLMAAKAVVSGIAGAASRGIENRLAGIFGGGAPGADASTPRARPPRAGAAVGRNAAAAGGGIGKGLGNIGGGILKGIAGGLKAFANPQVAIGAAVVAGTILVIGGAIAGASWLLGKALPTLVDGIKSFEEIDGAALKSAAVGMLAISGAMAAFGAGSAVAGLGSLVGSITSGLGSLFGGETDPIAQMKKFGEADIDAEKVKSNAEALVAFSTAMAAAGGASAAEGLGSLVSGIAGGIGALFGGNTTDDIFDDMQRFAGYDIDTAKVRNNADAMVAFSRAMALASGSSAVDGLGTLVSGIAGGIGALFGGNTTNDIFEDMQRFAGYDIDVEKVRNNASAMAAFSAAMSSGATASSAGAGASISSFISGFFGGDTPLDQVREFGEMQLNAEQITTNANAIRTMSTALNSFAANELDDAPIISYTEAIESLTEALGNLNEELSQDNDTLMTSRADAGELLSGISTSSRGTAEGTSQLNNTMQAMLQTLADIKDINTRTERNTQAITSGNLAGGYVSRTG